MPLGRIKLEGKPDLSNEVPGNAGNAPNSKLEIRRPSRPALLFREYGNLPNSIVHGRVTVTGHHELRPVFWQVLLAEQDYAIRSDQRSGSARCRSKGRSEIGVYPETV